MEKNIQKNKLVEIKKGQTGTGLLIESDGYVSRDLSANNKRIIQEAFDSREDGSWNVPNPFVLDVVLQKFGVQNANGRIYPEDVLKREVIKYQKMIDERMALGECYTPDAECLTPNGWVSIADVKEGDEVVTLNTTNNEIEIQKVTYKHDNDWDGILYNVKCELIDDVLTPNHSYPLYDYDNSFVNFVSVKDIKRSKPNLFLPITKDCSVSISTNDLTFTEVDYKGKVYCIEVPNHTWFVRQNGHEHWTKNCNHPAESNIDLGRITHNIIECHWEGHTLMGKIEFNLTEGYRRYGICSSFGDTCANLIMNGYKIGVSSRGVGSVENKLGKTIVCPDFELICWDVVATPSTPGSYIGNRESLDQYVESNTTTKHKGKLQEKMMKIKNILNG